jgi:hypothetical protein
MPVPRTVCAGVVPDPQARDGAAARGARRRRDFEGVTMGLRIGTGFRLCRHVLIGASVPLGHGRRLAAHRGHGNADPIQMAVGAVFLWVFLRVCWGLAWGPSG